MRLDSEASHVRAAVYDTFVRTGRGPTLDELVVHTELPLDIIRSRLHDLAAIHVVVLQRSADAIWMAMPFSGVPTDFRVTAEQPCGTAGTWWANCAWDALGIPAMFAGAGMAVGDAPMHVATTCPDCEEPLSLTVHADVEAAADAVRLVPSASHDGGARPVVHFAVAASQWWDSIGFT